MERPRILVCGGRDFTDKKLLFETLSPYRVMMQSHWPVIITGYDPDKEYPTGADQMAFEYAENWGLEHIEFPYHYHLGKKGGSSRNQQMIDEGKPDLVVAFPTPASRGTWDMVRRAQKNNIETIVINGPIAKDFK